MMRTERLIRMAGLEVMILDHPLEGGIEAVMAMLRQRDLSFDQYEELFIFESETQLNSAIQWLEAQDIETIRCELMLLPSDRVTAGELFEDYIIHSKQNHVYLDLAISAIFSLEEKQPGAEPVQAAWQLEEHLIGTIKLDHEQMYLIDRQLVELADRIAHAYGCQTSWQA
ncbi:MAG: hypothetical protein P0Y55_10380 [Candidatus Cohnella colombiensis]|uniref:Uncharacterized protein n=1 Tax=Candidatus Cohnella colombiensis TaxID=3121368 RepID=A0AA95J992_9BACL|nr:MAG: hypothetical protein P0Y55_10380 [Cohnella sp.]